MKWKHNNLFLLKRQENYLELHLKHFVTGMNRVKSLLLNLHPEYACIVTRIYATFLSALILFQRKGKLLIVELVPKNKKMTLNDKKIFSEPTILITNWLQMLGRELIGREKDLYPFWTLQCLGISQSLWLPTETDSVDSHSISSNTFSNHEELNSLCWMKKIINPKIQNSQMTYCPSYMFIPVETWEGEDIRTRRVRIYPTVNQKKQLKKWIGTSRYVYNRSLVEFKKENSGNFYSLRNKFVTAKNNPNIQPWELETPKDIRAGAIRDMMKGYKTAITNIKRGNINHFNLRFRNKKHESSIEIPKTAISIKKGNFQVYKTYLGTIKTSKDKYMRNLTIDYDCRLHCKQDKWFIYVPVKVKMNTNMPKHYSCALDPGTRKFQTIYSEEIAIKIGIRKDFLRKLYEKLDTFQSLRSRKIIKNSSYKRRTRKLWFRINNLIDDLHYKTISLLTSNFRTIFLPKFESQEIGRRMTFKSCKRDLFTLKHYLFQQRLLNKAKTYKYCNAFICTEEYTSKTCGACGILNNVGMSEVYRCRCGLTIDRDINGARNILIKTIKELL